MNEDPRRLFTNMIRNRLERIVGITEKLKSIFLCRPRMRIIFLFTALYCLMITRVIKY